MCGAMLGLCDMWWGGGGVVGQSPMTAHMVRRFRFNFFSLQSETKRNGIRFTSVSHCSA